MVLIKTAQIKAQRHKSNKQPGIPVSPAFGIDIFSTMDQTGNHPSATARNVVAERLTDVVVLNTASFLDLPFADNVFTLVTSSLACECVCWGALLSLPRPMARLTASTCALQCTTHPWTTAVERLGSWHECCSPAATWSSSTLPGQR